MLPDSFVRLGVAGGPWLEKRRVKREAFPEVQDVAAELTAFDRYAKARTISILHMGDDRFITWCRLARIASGGFGTVSAAIDDAGEIWAVKKLRRTSCPWASEATPRVREGVGVAPKPAVTDDHSLSREFQLATRFGGGRWAPIAFCTPTRAYLVTRAARGDLVDVMLMPSCQHRQAAAWCQQTVFFALSDVCEGLAGVHELGLVHNDLKANNVLLLPGPSSDSSRFALCDFGLAFNPQIGETGAANSALGAPEVLAAELGSAESFFDLTATDDQQRWCRRQRADIWSLGLMGVSLAVGQQLLEEALPACRLAGSAVDESVLIGAFEEFERVRALSTGQIHNLAQAEEPVGLSLTLACARLWREVDRRAPYFSMLLREMLVGDVAARLDRGEVAARLRSLSVSLPRELTDRQSYFQRADTISKVDQAAFIARLWQHGALRQGLLMQPGQFSAPRRALTPPADMTNCSEDAYSSEKLVEPTFRRAIGKLGGERAPSTAIPWAPLSPWFDPAYYACFVQRGRLSLSTCPEDAADVLAARAYVTAGLDRGERASIYYDPTYYRLQRSELAEASFSELVEDFRRHGLDDGVAASADFDPAAFRRRRAYDINRWILSLQDGELAAELHQRSYLAAIAFHAVELRQRLQMPSIRAGEVAYPRMSRAGRWPS